VLSEVEVSPTANEIQKGIFLSNLLVVGDTSSALSAGNSNNNKDR